MGKRAGRKGRETHVHGALPKLGERLSGVEAVEVHLVAHVEEHHLRIPRAGKGAASAAAAAPPRGGRALRGGQGLGEMGRGAPSP